MGFGSLSARLFGMLLKYRFLFAFSGFEQWSEQAPPTRETFLPVMSPPASIVSYEDDFISSQESVTIADKRATLEPRYLMSSQMAAKINEKPCSLNKELLQSCFSSLNGKGRLPCYRV